MQMPWKNLDIEGYNDTYVCIKYNGMPSIAMSLWVKIIVDFRCVSITFRTFLVCVSAELVLVTVLSVITDHMQKRKQFSHMRSKIMYGWPYHAIYYIGMSKFNMESKD